MFRFSNTLRLATLTFVTCLLLSGCGGGNGKPTKVNYEMIQTGQTEKEVEDLKKQFDQFRKQFE